MLRRVAMRNCLMRSGWSSGRARIENGIRTRDLTCRNVIWPASATRSERKGLQPLTGPQFQLPGCGFVRRGDLIKVRRTADGHGASPGVTVDRQRASSGRNDVDRLGQATPSVGTLGEDPTGNLQGGEAGPAPSPSPRERLVAKASRVRWFISRRTLRDSVPCRRT